MRVTVWMCDRCGRMSPEEKKPNGWYELSYIIIGERGSDTKIFCANRCVSIFFRGLDQTEEEGEEDEAVAREASSTALCPVCGWESKAQSKSPAQSLRMHLRRVHPGEGLEEVVLKAG